MSKYKKKNVFILGASSEIGIEVIKKFSNNQKFNLYTHAFQNSKNFEKNDKLKIHKKYILDFSNLKKVKKFIKRNNKDLSKIDIFISLTGYLKKDKKNNFSDYENILKHIKINYLSNLIFLNYLLPKMEKRKFGRVLLSSSIGIKFGGSPHTVSYSISKYLNEFFITPFNRFYQKNLFFNILRIGVTNTKIHKKTPNKNMKKRIALIPTKKIAKSSEVAEYVYYYASEENKLVNKQIIDISGGE